MEIFDISYDKVEIIRELWEKNRQYHERTSEFFKESYRFLCFEDRIKAFSTLNKDEIKITVAKINDQYVGYCLSTAVKGKGELESMHVDETMRGKGIGTELAIRHLQWMREKNCDVIGVTVSQENKSTIAFYSKLGFYPNTLYMQQMKFLDIDYI